MSSFLGHSLAAATVYAATEFICLAGEKSWLKSDRLAWLGWLIVVASIPDLDYVIHAWNSTNNQGLRITHSILFSLTVPCLTIVWLWLGKRQNPGKKSIQVVMAGLSHLALDLSVGVTPLPLLFPFVKIPFKLPFGILPSAGRINLDNYYFYRNLWLEMGVLLPLFIIVCLFGINRSTAKNTALFKFVGLSVAIALLICAGYFIQQNLQLPR